MADQRRSRSPRRVRPQDAATIPPWREQRARSGPAQPMGNHVAARSLEQVFEGSGAGPAEHARPAPRLHTTVFQSLKRVVGNATHVPLTHAELSIASAKGPGLKPPTRGQMANVHGGDFPMRRRLPPRGQCCRACRVFRDCCEHWSVRTYAEADAPWG